MGITEGIQPGQQTEKFLGVKHVVFVGSVQ